MGEIVVATLKELGLYDDTAIILTCRPRRHGRLPWADLSKGAYMYDEIYRVPMLFKPPGGTDVRRSLSAAVCEPDGRDGDLPRT